jgi:hypothetical protein
MGETPKRLAHLLSVLTHRNICCESYGQVGYVVQSEMLMSTVPADPIILNIMTPLDGATP